MLSVVQNRFSAVLRTALLALLATVLPVQADTLSAYDERDDNISRQEWIYQPYPGTSNRHSLGYLKQARRLRAERRYELARQHYLMALSLCTDQRTLDILKRELDGVELLLRTMR
ncbi:MAG: hypothetical protein IJU37_03545 [Desulfovibrio sp.]|nr:hypothetical protein [Desulfovibrio sp.]